MNISPEFLSPLQLLCENEVIPAHKTRINPIPPPAVSDFIVVDEGNCSPNFVRSSMYILPSSLSSRQSTSSIPIGFVMQPLYTPNYPLFVHTYMGQEMHEGVNRDKEVVEDSSKINNFESRDELPLIELETQYDLDTFRCYNCSTFVNNSDYFHDIKYTPLRNTRDDNELNSLNNIPDNGMKVGKMEYRCSVCLKINRVPEKLKLHSFKINQFLQRFSKGIHPISGKSLSPEAQLELQQLYQIKEKEFQEAHSKILDHFAHILEYKTNYIRELPKPHFFNGSFEFLVKSTPLPPLSELSFTPNRHFVGTSLIYVFVLDISVLSQRSGVISSFVLCLQTLLDSSFFQPLYISIIVFDSEVRHFVFKSPSKKPNIVVFPFSDPSNNENDLFTDDPSLQFPLPIDQLVINCTDKKDLIQKAIQMLSSVQFQTSITDKNNSFGVALLAALKILQIHKLNCKYCKYISLDAFSPSNCKCRCEVITFLSSHPSAGFGSLLVKNASVNVNQNQNQNPSSSSSSFRSENNEKSRKYYEKLLNFALPLRCSIHLFLYGNHKLALHFYQSLADKTNGKLFYFAQYSFNDISTPLSLFSTYFIPSNRNFINAFNCKLKISFSNLYQLRTLIGNFVTSSSSSSSSPSSSPVDASPPTDQNKSDHQYLSKLKQLWEWNATKTFEENFETKTIYFPRFDSHSSLSMSLEYSSKVSAIHQFLKHFSDVVVDPSNSFDDYSDDHLNIFRLLDNHKFTLQLQFRYHCINHKKNVMEKRLRVHTLNLPISHNLTKLFAASDVETINYLLIQSLLYSEHQLFNPPNNINNVDNNNINIKNNNINNNEYYSKSGALEKLQEILLQYQRYSIRNNRRAQHELGDIQSSKANFLSLYPLLSNPPIVNHLNRSLRSIQLPSSLHLLPIFIFAFTKSFLADPLQNEDLRNYFKSRYHSMSVADFTLLLYPRLMALDPILYSSTDRFFTLPPLFSLSKHSLKDDRCYLLDNGVEFYLWVGRNIPSDFKIGDKQLTQYVKYIPVSDLSSVHPLISILFSRHKTPKSLVIIEQGNEDDERIFEKFLIEDESEREQSHFEFLSNLHLLLFNRLQVQLKEDYGNEI